jgi:hypothetical protein
MTVPCAYTDTPRSTLPSVAAPLLCFILPVACCTLRVRRASPRRAGRAGDSDLLEHGRAQLALVLLTPSLHHCTECEYAAADKKPWPVPHLHWDWARPCHVCTGTGLNPATSAPGLGSILPRLHRDWAHPCHICTGTRAFPNRPARLVPRPLASAVRAAVAASPAKVKARSTRCARERAWLLHWRELGAAAAKGRKRSKSAVAAVAGMRTDLVLREDRPKLHVRDHVALRHGSGLVL